jgi:hypothetical protein
VKALLVLFGLLTGALCFGDVTGPVTGTLPTNVSAPSNGQCLTYSGTVWVNGSCGSVTPATPVQGYDTPLHEGAVGNGIANDTTPVQTCVTTGACYLPPTYTFLINTTISVPAYGNLIGGGWGTFGSTIQGNSVSGPCIQIGTVGPNTPKVNLANFQITGSCTIGIEALGSYFSRFRDILITSGTFSLYGFDFDHSSFGLSLSNLVMDGGTGLTVGSTMTFSGAVAGLATQTITAGSPGNGAYMMVFSNGEVRRVTVSGSTLPTNGTATWTGNIAAGSTGGTASFSTTTANYGGGFLLGSGENDTTADKLVAVNGTTSVPFGFIFEDVNGYGSTISGSTFNNPTAENCQVCYFFGSVVQNIVVNSLYCENCVLPILVGESAGGYISSGVTVHGANMSGPLATNPYYANRYTFLDIQDAYGFIIHQPIFAFSDGKGMVGYELTFAGGTQTTAPRVYGFTNAAGVMRGCAILYPGDYGTGAQPTLTASYTGGNPGSGATFSITAGLTPYNNQGVTGCTVSAGGSGYTDGTGMVPVTINAPTGAIIDQPVFGSFGQTGNLSISPMMAYDSINASGLSRQGYTITNDTGYYNAEYGADLNGSTVNHATESSYREWVQFIGIPGVAPISGSYIVPMVPWP